MIEILDMQDENILGFRVDGKMEKADLQKVFRSFVEKAENNGKIKFYTEIKEFGIEDLTAEAIKEDI